MDAVKSLHFQSPCDDFHRNYRNFRYATFLLAVALQAQTGGRGPVSPPVVSQSVRPTGTSLGRIRVGAADEKIWFGWRVGVPAPVFKQLTFSEAAAKTDALILADIEGFDTQRVSAEIPKNLDYRLLPGERAAVGYRLRELNMKMSAYRVSTFGPDAASRRKVFELAKELGVQTVVTSADAASLADLDQLAGELGVNVAIESHGDPKNLMRSLEGRSKHIGIFADTRAWAEAGVQPVDGLAIVKDRLMGVRVLGDASQLTGFFMSAFHQDLTPLYIAIDSQGTPDIFSDLSNSIAAWEKAMQPVMAARIQKMLDSPTGKIRGPELLSADMRQQIDAAVPRKPIVAPKKPRKMLVMDLQMYSGHTSIPHGNWMLEEMGKYTGAFTPTFSNDLNNLKYPKIKEFDAVYFNNICGMVFEDPEVREGILRFVREGGGVGGHHAITFAALDWPEFTEMMGMWSGAHHTETQFIKVDDTSSPLTAMFAGKSFEHTDEFYHMPMSSPYSREKQHVLLSLDVEKSDMATGRKFCAECTRTDQDYALSWIKTYGKGRVFCSPLGHTPILYTSPQWEQHILAVIQYILGDLDADATPSAKLSARNGRP